MARYKITIEYDGTGFVGWQRQDNGVSVQGILESAIQKFSGYEVVIFGAGRTDAGVHAYGQVAHFDLKTVHPMHSIQQAINHFCKPNRVSVIKIELVKDDFHARFSCLKKTYLYRICNRGAPLALMDNYAWLVKKELSVEKMREASKIFIGKHDFSTFRATACQGKSPIKSIDDIKIEVNGDFISIYFTAKSFLHNQVRIMTGGLYEVGIGKGDAKDLKKAMDMRDRKEGPVTAPAKGLFLFELKY